MKLAMLGTRAVSLDCIWVQSASKGRLYLRGRDFRAPAC